MLFSEVVMQRNKFTEINCVCDGIDDDANKYLHPSFLGGKTPTLKGMLPDCCLLVKIIIDAIRDTSNAQSLSI